MASVTTTAVNEATDVPAGASPLQRFLANGMSLKERFKAGKLLRTSTPRAQHAELPLPADRLDPVTILENQASDRVPTLLPVRYARMLTSPFAFLRGAAAVMAADLSRTAVTGIRVQACGDAHLSNFGLFGTVERNLIFSINDFDETLPAPWEWDLKRLAASAVVCGRFLGGSDKDCRAAASGVVRSYRKHIRKYARMGHLDVWYSRIDERKFIDAFPGEMRAGAQRFTQRARRRTHVQVLDKLTDIINDRQQIVEDAPLIVRETHTVSGIPVYEALDRFLESYLPSLPEDRRLILSRFRLRDVARKVVGVGSVGTRCWMLYLHGNTDHDPLFLQLKQASASVLEPYAGASEYQHHGLRVVAGQRIIQRAPDIFLGWGTSEQFHFYVRQLRDMKGSAEFREGDDDARLSHLKMYCELCGWALALAHAKSGDAALIGGYVGRSEELDDAISQFAVYYAEQTEADYSALEQAARTGRICAATG